MAEIYKKPQSPLYDFTNDFYFYPLTTADQVILEDGNRLNTVLPESANVQKILNQLLLGTTIFLPQTGWVGESAPYSQTVSVEGMTSDRKFWGLTSEDTLENMVEINKALSLIQAIESGEGVVTFYASQKPEIDLTVNLKG